MGHRLIAIDPGKKTGIARFVEGELTAAYVCSPDGAKKAITHVIKSYSLHTFVIEVPRIYPNERRIDQNDLIDLALLAGEYGGIASLHRVEYVYPRVWKGSVPKPIHNLRVLEQLTAEEKKRFKGKDHNMIDAIGLGLWSLKKEGIR